MKLYNKLNDVYFLHFVDGQILFQNFDSISDVLNNSSVAINQYNGSYSGNYLYRIEENRVVIFNSKLVYLKSILVDNPTSITILTNDNYIISSVIDNKKYYNFYSNDNLVKVEENIVGKFLNSEYRLHFKFRFKPIIYFRCSDLLDEVTCWEYDCGEGYTAARFNVWKNTLVFTKSRDLDSYLLMIDLPTGDILWETSIPYPDFILDEETGLLISVWGSEQAGNNYQMVNLNKRTIEGGKILPQFSFHNVNLAHSFRDGHYLYFTDSPVQYGDNWVFDTPRIGCFDYMNKILIYYKEIPELKEKGINQMVVKGDTFYLRTPENELYIFKDDAVV